ncbi:MAG TPA: hypothetical protein P5246_02285 [Candidatus Omnitrophota bacterium]|nr:hypothetical protein [Candidatus Omnitrophota bacterium]HSA31663.1 hypothetical protein [Candidatus Omnitrophota bacterium]
MGLALAIAAIIFLGIIFIVLSLGKPSEREPSAAQDPVPQKPKSLSEQYQAQFSNSSQYQKPRPAEPIKNEGLEGGELFKVMAVFIVVGCFGFFFKNFILEPGSLLPIKASALLSEPQYQNICLARLKPMVEEMLQAQLKAAFSATASPTLSFEEEMAAFAQEQGFPCAASLMKACADAEKRYDPAGNARVFADQ